MSEIFWLKNHFFLSLIRMSVKTTFVFWLKPILVRCLFAARTVSNPGVEPTQQFEKRPKFLLTTRKITKTQTRLLRQQQLVRVRKKGRSVRELPRQCSPNWLTMEFYDWSTNSQAPVFALLTPATILQQFSQVNKIFFDDENWFLSWLFPLILYLKIIILVEGQPNFQKVFH